MGRNKSKESKVEIIPARFKDGTRARLQRIVDFRNRTYGTRLTVASLIEETVNERYPERQSILDRI